MKFTPEERNALATVAKDINVPFEAFLAVIQIESAGKKGEVINGNLEPIIRYEGHYFDKLCPPSVREAARKAGISSPTAGGVKNPASQVNRWALVRKAATYDRYAAYASCSYGVGQVMGSHWEKLGFKSIDDFLALARSGLVGQARIMALYIKIFGLDDELRALDWSGFARGYNGKNYKKYEYDTKLADAYKQQGGYGTTSPAVSGLLRLGSKGAGVRELQGLLNLAGYKINVDGDFGTTTRAAVRAFQTAQGIAVDGKVGPETNQALMAIRSVAPKDVGQEKLTEITEVKQGIGIAAAPAVIAAAKDQLVQVAEQLTPYAALGKVTEYINMGITALTVSGLVVGAGLAVYGWYKSRQSFTGSKTDPDIEVIDHNTDLIIPA